MWPATAWDDEQWGEARARGWTVMGRLRQRQREALDSPRADDVERHMMTARSPAAHEQSLQSRARQGPTVVALLFAHPDSRAIRTLVSRGAYFDHRTGDTWDLFFPGYHRAADGDFETRVGSVPVGGAFSADWFFNPSDFDLFRRHVEKASDGRWGYSGGADLVLMNAWLPARGEPTVDCASTISGSLTEEGGAQTLTLGEVVERISRDLEAEMEDPAYGVRAVIDPAHPEEEGTTAARDVLVGALAGMATALGKKQLGL
jgi:hypothetical protein